MKSHNKAGPERSLRKKKRRAGTDEAAPAVHVFGDSHAKFFFRTGFYIPRLQLDTPVRYRIEGQHIPASSVAGFRPGDRKLNVKETIREQLPQITRLVLAFGQVDLELGYYYRLAVKKEDLTPQSYVVWLLGIYRDFVQTLVSPGCDIALKGANLTALAPKPFAAKYVARIIEGGRKTDSTAAQDLLPIILSEADQNAMHLDFNAGLRKLSQDLGIKYFDLVAETSRKAAVPVLDDLFKPADFDHHLVDSVVVRRMHYAAAGKAFGLQETADTGPA